jgi:hypothetical protein
MMDGELRELGERLSQYTGRFVLSGGQAAWKHVGTIVMDAQSGKPGNWKQRPGKGCLPSELRACW